jgi:hypothetical protein
MTCQCAACQCQQIPRFSAEALRAFMLRADERAKREAELMYPPGQEMARDAYVMDRAYRHYLEYVKP